MQQPEPRISLCTYRLQFNSDFTFNQASEIVPYLSALGVSHVYASPYLQARPGSKHGYDIIDHNRLNPEIGTDADEERAHRVAWSAVKKKYEKDEVSGQWIVSI